MLPHTPAIVDREFCKDDAVCDFAASFSLQLTSSTS